MPAIASHTFSEISSLLRKISDLRMFWKKNKQKNPCKHFFGAAAFPHTVWIILSRRGVAEAFVCTVVAVAPPITHMNSGQHAEVCQVRFSDWTLKSWNSWSARVKQTLVFAKKTPVIQISIFIAGKSDSWNVSKNYLRLGLKTLYNVISEDHSKWSCVKYSKGITCMWPKFCSGCYESCGVNITLRLFAENGKSAKLLLLNSKLQLIYLTTITKCLFVK